MDTYKFIGHQHGHFTDENGEIRNYATVFATTPVGGSREGYQAAGLKSCILKCADVSVLLNALKEIDVGDDVQLYFNEYKKVALIMPAK